MLQMLNHAGEAKEEKEQQMELRRLQREAIDEEPRTTGKENFKRGGENQLNHNYADKEIGVFSKWGEYSKIQHKDDVDHSFAYKATSSIMSKFKRPACENANHGFPNIGSSSVMKKLKRPASKWNDFLDDDDNDLELEMSRCEEVNNAAFERMMSDRKTDFAGWSNQERHGNFGRQILLLLLLTIFRVG
ncbi:hypothetical protein Tco_0987659 [Tanacetum coccineum]